MTPGTGKRSYRACTRCRRRKTKCDLDGVGEEKKPPCVFCYRSGSDCVLADSRRGRGIQSSHVRSDTRAPSSRTSIGVISDHLAGSTGIPPISKHGEGSPSDDTSEMNANDYVEQSTEDNLRMELRNPSDALHILARSDEVPSSLRVDWQSPSETRSPASAATHPMTSVQSAAPNHIPPSVNAYESTAGVLDDYELVQRGLLHPSVLPELLLIFARRYHPYCPITPPYLLGQLAMEKIQRSDYFLLTVILTIASRDSPKHSLTHRYCWDHTQRLLLEVLLAQPWAYTTRTVEGLLLLSEWLPHIQTKQSTTDGPKNLFSEDRTAWSLVGLAVRQGYLLRLDRAAFRGADTCESKEQEERKRLVWAFIFLADRQISVRLGQSFWSRGPSLSSRFTAKDFPSLGPRSGSRSEDYASVLQATLELTQILHNAHIVLYSSTARTLTMVYDGDYARYLDDFQRAAMTWHGAWSDIRVPKNTKSMLLLMYEYICLYVNAFSFQAVLTRASAPRPSLEKEQQANRRPLADLFSRGIMSSPDGRYIFGAISAAMNLLIQMNSLDAKAVLCYIPSRYYLYGVYAAVFLHKAQSAGAFQTNTIQASEVTNLALRFICSMEKAPSTESHICHAYGRMLRRLWYRRPSQSKLSQSTTTFSDRDESRECNRSRASPTSPVTSPAQMDDQWHDPGGMSSEFLSGMDGLVDDVVPFPSVDQYLSESFFPGITNFGQQEQFQGNESRNLELWTEDLKAPGFEQIEASLGGF